MTALQQPPRADGTPQPPVRVPFPVVDEVARHCLQEEEPETVHIEVHLPGRLDAGRLRAAFAQALRRHPRILMREAPGRWYRRRYEWELTAEPDVEVVGFAAPGRDALRDARTRALTEAPPLSLSPPIRVEVVEGAGPGAGRIEGSEAGDAVGVRPRGTDGPRPRTARGTVLFLTINHTALDGPACLRVLATAAELYGGQDNSPAAPPVRTSSDAPPPPEDTPSNWSHP
ncbi:condensation protein, partial [Streptomyces viridochromogenes]